MNDSPDRHNLDQVNAPSGIQTDANHTGSEPDSPNSPEAKAQVDELIDHVNQQIELLTLDQPDPFLLRQMVHSLIDPRRPARIALVECFSQIGEPATPYLLEGVASHPEPVVRRACCNALTNIGDPSSVDGLIKALLYDSDIGVKSAAAGALTKVGAPAFDSLRTVLASDQASESCKGHAAWAIASMSSEVSERLYRHMSDPSPAVRTAVIGAIAQLAQKQQVVQPETSQKEAAQHQTSQSKAASRPGRGQQETGQQRANQQQMGHLQTESASRPPGHHRSESAHKALTMLTEALNDPSPEVRIEAAANLARLHYQQAYQPLIACLKDRQAEVRKAAALALAKLGNPDAIEAITALQRDVETSVQRVAAMAVRQLQESKQA